MSYAAGRSRGRQRLLLESCPAAPDAQQGKATDGGQALPSCEPTTCERDCVAQGGGSGRCTGAGTCLCANVPASCSLGEKVACYAGPTGTAGRGACKAGSITCISLGELTTWSACEGEALPSAEKCNGVDDDCDGAADEGLSCRNPGESCAPGDECAGGTSCIEFPDGRRICDAPPTCTTPKNCPNGTRWGPTMECTEFPDGVSRCYDRPSLTCRAHYLFNHVAEDGLGHHYDTCMNCRADQPEGSSCVAGMGTELECAGAMVPELWKMTGGDGGTPARSFLAMDQPMEAPSGFTKCLYAWGVHPLRSLSTNLDPARGVVGVKAVARLPSIPGAPLTAEGLSTRTPAAAFQHSFAGAPPGTKKPIPTEKSERGARVFWEEPSTTNMRQTPLPQPYYTCNTCSTFGELVDHLYPGPEIFCQGLPRDPADSQFVVPFWLPYYESLYGTPNLVIISEAVCRTANGKLSRSVTAMPLPAEGFGTYPVTF